jgi:hypothetical protein
LTGWSEERQLPLDDLAKKRTPEELLEHFFGNGVGVPSALEAARSRIAQDRLSGLVNNDDCLSKGLDGRAEPIDPSPSLVRLALCQSQCAVERLLVPAPARHHPTANA